MEGPRGLKPSEFESLCTLVNTVFRADGSGRMEQQYPLLFAEENFDDLLVMVDDSKVVSHVGTLTRDISVLGHRIGTISIGAVATYEAYRGRGLATRLMDAAIQKGRDEGSALMLISGGRGLYRRLGATCAGQYVCYGIPRDALPGGAATFVPVTDADLPGLVRRYAHEPSRYVRSTDDFRTCIDAGWICDRSGDTLVIREGGDILAYAGVQKPRADRADEADRARLTEIAGSRAAIVVALPGLYERYGVQTLEIVTAQADIELKRLLQQHPITARPQAFMGTSLVLLPETLLDILADYISDILGSDRLSWTASEQEVAFRCEGHTANIRADMLGQLVFGVVEPDLDPCDTLPDGPLREALNAVFPVQLPWYGYNFV